MFLVEKTLPRLKVKRTMVIFINLPSPVKFLLGYRSLETRLQGEVGEISAQANVDIDNRNFHELFPVELKANQKRKQAFLK